MADISLHFDKRAEKSLNELKEYYDADAYEIIRKALSVLKALSNVKKENGEVYVKRGEFLQRVTF